MLCMSYFFSSKWAIWTYLWVKGVGFPQSEQLELAQEATHTEHLYFRIETAAAGAGAQFANMTPRMVMYLLRATANHLYRTRRSPGRHTVASSVTLTHYLVTDGKRTSGVMDTPRVYRVAYSLARLSKTWHNIENRVLCIPAIPAYHSTYHRIV